MAELKPTRISHPEIEATVCPKCGEGHLYLESRFTAKELGTYSLAGVGMKLSVTPTFWIVCDHCGVEAKGHS